MEQVNSSQTTTTFVDTKLGLWSKEEIKAFDKALLAIPLTMKNRYVEMANLVGTITNDQGCSRYRSQNILKIDVTEYTTGPWKLDEETNLKKEQIY